MGLFDRFNKNVPQDFNECINSLSAEERKEILDRLSKHGDPDQILTDLLNTPSCCLNREIDVRINDDFVLRFYKKKPKTGPQIYLGKTAAIDYCYHSYCKNGKYSEVGCLTRAGFSLIFSGLTGNEALAIYRKLQPYAHGFDQLPFDEKTDEVLLPSFDRLHYYYFKGDSLYSRRYTEIKKEIKDAVYIPNIQDIIWCDQWSSWDSEASDSYALDVYLVNQKRPLCLFSGHEIDAFKIVMELKKRVPHLLYGPSEEYKKIFKQNPADLMALAKSKLQK